MNDILAELERLHHRQADLRARERRLAEAGEDDPASDACEFEAGICPWVGDEPEPEPAFSSPVPECAAWLRRPNAESAIVEEIEP